jgi:hypothetical protein
MDWARSKRGNWWRTAVQPHGVVLRAVVFRTRRREWSWLLTDDGEGPYKRWSDFAFPTEAEARDDVEAVLRRLTEPRPAAPKPRGKVPKPRIKPGAG